MEKPPTKARKMVLQKLLIKDKGARKMMWSCTEWYWVAGGHWTYLFTECGPSGGGGGETTPVQVFGRLCGTYTFQRTGEGRTAEIHGLGSQAYNSSNNNHVSASWPAMCVTFGNSIQTSNNASIAFN